MFYYLLKLYARFAIKIYCKKIIINKPEILKIKGPVLFASNHPNSFLDGMILTTILNERLYSLVRGDAFKNKKINKFLRKLQLLPVYRTSEGVENLEYNYDTFIECHQAFEQNAAVLIFSEGRCVNEWHLRSLRKGTARLATSSWQKQIPLTVIPMAFNYSSFKKIGKEVHLLFGDAIIANQISATESAAKQLLFFNELLNQQLKQLVYEIDPSDKITIKKIFSIKIKPSFYFLLIPAVMGWIFHAPLFYSCQLFSKHTFQHTGHYDSVLTALLLLLYPLYILVVFFGAYYIQPVYGFLSLPLMSFTAWACIQAKYQVGL